jgi:prepilin-type N-terminal cleavage/methylation domain-containing protein
MKRTGFTLIECLLGLALSLLVVAAGLEFFARAQDVFVRLKAREEAGQAALAAIDKMRIDLLHAGAGLSVEIGLGLIEAAQASADELRTVSLERALALAATAGAGDTRIALSSTSEIAAGQVIVLRDGAAGEVRTVVRIEPGSVAIDAPLAGSYAPASAAVSLLETVAYRLDGPARVLRRRVNASPAQPLFEGAAAAAWTMDPAAPLVRLRLEPDTQGAHPHEATVFLKNAALARR